MQIVAKQKLGTPHSQRLASTKPSGFILLVRERRALQPQGDWQKKGKRHNIEENHNIRSISGNEI